METLPEIQRSPIGLRALEILLRYILEVQSFSGDFPEDAIKAFLQSDLSEASMESFMTGAQFYEQKGWQKGVAEGQRAERQVLLERLLTQRFGPLPEEALARLRSADYEQLGAWIDRLFTASSLQDLLH